MSSALRAFPADGYTARWQRWDHDGDETLTLTGLIRQAAAGLPLAAPRELARIFAKLTPDDEVIEFICNENNQFRQRVKID